MGEPFIPIEGQSFASEQSWIISANRALTMHPDYNNTEHGDDTGWRGPHFTALCFDQAGNRMRCGADFVRATREGTYPVWWIWPDQIVEAIARPTTHGSAGRQGQSGRPHCRSQPGRSGGADGRGEDARIGGEVSIGAPRCAARTFTQNVKMRLCENKKRRIADFADLDHIAPERGLALDPPAARGSHRHRRQGAPGLEGGA